MNSNWQTITLKDVTSKLGDGLHGTPLYDESGGYFFINGNNLFNGIITINNLTKKCSKGEYEKHKKELNDRTILVSINGTIGNVAVYNNEPVFLGKSACYMNVLPEIDLQFIRYVLTAPHFQNYIHQRASGSTIKNVSLKLMREYEFQLPPKDLQYKISSTLKCLDDKIANNTAMNQTLEKIAQRIFKSWFIDFDPVKANAEGVPFNGLSPEIQALFPNKLVDSGTEFGLIPEGWGIVEFGDVIDFKNGYAFKSQELMKDANGATHKVFKMGNIKKGGGFKDEGSGDYFNASMNEKALKHTAKKGDLLMCMTDMKANMALLGHTALMPFADEYLVNQRVGHIRPSKYLGSVYLYLLSNSYHFINDIGAKSNSGVQVNLSTTGIKDTRFVCPSESVHAFFRKTTEPLFEKMFSNIEINLYLERLRNRLLPKLINGSISLSEVNQELKETE